MGDHNSPNTRVNGPLERHPLYLHKFTEGAVDFRQGFMAVLMGIAVAWKMLTTGQHTILLNPFNDSYAQCIHEIWIGTKGSGTNNRVVWIRIDV